MIKLLFVGTFKMYLGMTLCYIRSMRKMIKRDIPGWMLIIGIIVASLLQLSISIIWITLIGVLYAITFVAYLITGERIEIYNEKCDLMSEKIKYEINLVLGKEEENYYEEDKQVDVSKVFINEEKTEE